MANGLLQPFSRNDAMGAFGLGLLNQPTPNILDLSNRQFYKSDPVLAMKTAQKTANPLAQTINTIGQAGNLYKAMTEGKNESFSGTNPTYQLPENNPVMTTIGNLDVNRLVNAIGMFESGNKYDSLGPVTHTGDRAYGKYQVMGNNIPVWTKEVLGMPMTTQEFLSNPAAQDAVAKAKLGGYLKQYGNPQDAESAWFSGRPLRNNSSKDILGTSVPEYVSGVSRYY